MFCFTVLSVILAHSQTAASPVTFVLNFQDEVRKEAVVVVMTGIEAEGVEREEEGEEEKPIEEDGKFLDMLIYTSCWTMSPGNKFTVHMRLNIKKTNVRCLVLMICFLFL